MASTVRTVDGAGGLHIGNNVNDSQKKKPHVEECGKVSYALFTVKLQAATDGVVDSDVDIELGRLGWVDGSNAWGFAVFAFYADTSSLAPYRTWARASA
nr:unnamed protein product [Haemonchus contortus]